MSVDELEQQAVGKSQGQSTDLPLTRRQELIWAQHFAMPDYPVYTSAAKAVIAGNIDPGRLTEAWRKLVARHEALRATVTMSGDGDPVYRILKGPAPDIEIIDVTEAPDPETLARERMGDVLATCFPEGGHFYRAALIKVSARKSIILLVMSHETTENMSWILMIRDLASLYAPAAGDDGSPGLEPAIAYSEHLDAYRDYCKSDAAAADRPFWDGLFPQPAPSLDLFGASASDLTGASACFDQPVARELSQTLWKNPGRVRPVMQFTVAAFIYLHRVTGQRDICIGVPMANRDSKHKNTVGLFMDILPVRIRIDPDETCISLTNKIRDFFSASRTHRRHSVSVQDARYQVILNYRNPAPSTFADMAMDFETFVPLSRIELAGMPEGVTQESLLRHSPSMTISIRQHGEGTPFSLEIETDRGTGVDEQGCAQIHQSLECILEQMLDRPDIAISDMTIMPEAMRAETVAHCMGPRFPQATAPGKTAEENGTLLHAFLARAAERPDSTAIVWNGVTLTYAEAASRMRALAGRLREIGVKPGTRVILCCNRSPDMVIGMLAAMHAGAAYVPVDPALPAARIAELIEQIEPICILAGPDTTHLLPAEPGAPVMDPAAVENGAQPLDHPDCGEIAYIIFTSGSTGKPKGVCVTHSNLFYFIQAMVLELSIDREDRFLSMTNVAFDVHACEFFVPLSNGAALYLSDTWRDTTPDRIQEMIDRDGITVIDGTPAIYSFLLSEGWRGAPDLKILCGGEKMTPGLATSLRRCGKELWNAYGPTETTINSLVTRVEEGVSPVPIGRPMAGTSAYILDRQGRLLPPNVPGDLYIGGPGVSAGYWRRDDLTAERFLPDPFRSDFKTMYDTGDRAIMRPDGTFLYLGRLDFQIKINDQRIEPGEIEATMRGLDGVAENVVVANKLENGGVELSGYYTVSEGKACSAEQLRQWLKAKLPPAMVPRHLVQVPAMPITSSGKIDRARLPAPNPRASDEQPAPSPPARSASTPEGMAGQLAAVFAEVLALETVRGDDDFFALGGTSLSAMRLVVRISTRFKIDCTIRQIYEHPTPQALAAVLAPAAQTRPVLARLDGSDDPPASFGQKQLWIEWARAPESAVYNVATILDLEGPLDAAALARAWREVMQTHAALRTTFYAEGAEIRQRIVDVPGASWAEIDLGPSDDAGAADAIAAEAKKPFDLRRAPLARAILFRRGTGSHTLLLAFHHIIIDEWSIGILQKDLAARYRRATGDSPVSDGLAEAIVEPAYTFGDFAAWQKSLIDQGCLEDQIDHWRRHLDGSVPEIDLPRDRVLPDTLGFEGSRIDVTLSAVRSDAVRQIVRRAQISEFSFMLSAYAVFLYRISRQADLVIGTPFAARTQAGLQSVIGYFLNTMPIRFKLDDNQSFMDFARATHAAIGAAISNGDVPLPHLIEVLKPRRDAFNRPFYQVQFAHNEGGADDLNLPGITVIERPAPAGTAKADVTFFTRLEGDAVKARLEYNTDLFSGTAAQAMMDGLEALLGDIVANPDRPVVSFSLMSDQDRNLLSAINRGQRVDYPRDQTIPALIDTICAGKPDACALEWRTESLSYRDLVSASHAISGEIVRAGTAPGDRVALLMTRGPSLIAAMIGVLRAGCAYVPLDPAYPPERLSFMLKDSGAKAIIAENVAHEVLQESNLPVIPGAEAAKGRPDGEPAPDMPDPESPAYIMYTSGSTGTPKGVVITHRNIVSLVKGADYADLTPESRILQLSPTSFDAATFEIWGPLLNGGTTILYPDSHVSSDGIAKAVAAHGVNCLFLTTALFNNIIDVDPDALSGAGRVLFGGEAASPAHAEKARRLLPSTRLSNVYGPTENTTFSTHYPLPGNDAPLTAVPIGRAIANATAYIMLPDGTPAPFGMPGELYLGGDGVAAGYHDRAGQTAERFVPNPDETAWDRRLYRSGDICRMSRDGTVTFIGRADTQVKIRGHRIELGEIEACLLEVDGIAQAVVQPQTTRAGETLLAAYVVPGAGAVPPSPEEIRNRLAAELPAYMVPSQVMMIDVIPLTPIGKVDRKALPKVRQTQGDAAPPPSAEPRSDLERGIAAAWKKVLGISAVGLDDSFFALGGTSLLALKLLAEMERLTGLRFTLQDIFATPTIRSLIDRRDIGAHEFRAIAVPFNTEGVGRPLFCLSSIGNYQELAKALDGQVSITSLFVAEEGQLLQQFARLDRAQAVALDLGTLVTQYSDAIIDQQPQGPYRLAGLSFGGLLAFEVAKELVRRGHGVEIVIMFDTVLPGRTLAQQAALAARTVLRAARRLRKRGQAMDGERTSTIYHSINATYVELMRRYRPEPSLIDSRVVFIEAEATRNRFDVPDDFGWGRIFRSFDRLRAKGQHLSLLRGENVETVAKMVVDKLRSLQDSG